MSPKAQDRERISSIQSPVKRFVPILMGISVATVVAVAAGWNLETKESTRAGGSANQTTGMMTVAQSAKASPTANDAKSVEAYENSKYAQSMATASGGKWIFVDSNGNRTLPPPNFSGVDAKSGGSRGKAKYSIRTHPSGARIIRPESPMMVFTYATVGEDGKVRTECHNGFNSRDGITKPGEVPACTVPGCGLANCAHGIDSTSSQTAEKDGSSR
jgi:hypothetical protein